MFPFKICHDWAKLSELFSGHKSTFFPDCWFFWKKKKQNIFLPTLAPWLLAFKWQAAEPELTNTTWWSFMGTWPFGPKDHGDVGMLECYDWKAECTHQEGYKWILVQLQSWENGFISHIFRASQVLPWIISR